MSKFANGIPAARFLVVALIAAMVPLISSDCFADAEARARQAEIDAGEAQNNIDQMNRAASQDMAIDGVDSPDAAAASAGIGEQENALQNAQQRETQADRQLAQEGE